MPPLDLLSEDQIGENETLYEMERREVWSSFLFSLFSFYICFKTQSGLSPRIGTTEWAESDESDIFKLTNKTPAPRGILVGAVWQE